MTFFQVAEEIGCKILNALLSYFMVATYMWMLCEGESAGFEPGYLRFIKRSF